MTPLRIAQRGTLALLLGLGLLLSWRSSGVDPYTSKASSYDLFRAQSPGWDTLAPELSLPQALTILDLGCGSGAFLAELAALRPAFLDATDTNAAMIAKAKQRVRETPLVMDPTKSKLRIRDGDVVNLKSDFYDVVFCAQILQNLSPDPEHAAAMRAVFLVQILRVLKPGGKLVLTTRAVSPGPIGRWSNLYWYADPAIVPEAVRTMELMVPAHPLQELAAAGFVRTKLLPSADTVVRYDEYLRPQNVKNPAFRSADSFFQHVKGRELAALLGHLDRERAAGTLEGYVKRRDALRGGRGHVATLIAFRPV